MKRLRPGIGPMMAVVAVVGLDLAACRTFLPPSDHFNYDLARFLSVAPIVVLLQLASFRLVLVRGKPRMFWAGFLGIGLLTATSILLAVIDPPMERTTFSSTGTTTEIYEGCWASQVWWAYLTPVYAWLRAVNYPFFHDKAGCVTHAVLIVGPQVVLAWAGGFLATRSAGAFGKSAAIAS